MDRASEHDIATGEVHRALRPRRSLLNPGFHKH